MDKSCVVPCCLNSTLDLSSTYCTSADIGPGLSHTWPCSAGCCKTTLSTPGLSSQWKLHGSHWLLLGVLLEKKKKCQRRNVCMNDLGLLAGADSPSQWPINHSQEVVWRRLPNPVWHAATFPENNDKLHWGVKFGERKTRCLFFTHYI